MLSATSAGCSTVSPSRPRQKPVSHVSPARGPGRHRARRPRTAGPEAECPKAPGKSLLVPPLHAGLTQQLAVLLLRHSLAALLDDGAHDTTLARRFGTTRHA